MMQEQGNKPASLMQLIGIGLESERFTPKTAVTELDELFTKKGFIKKITREGGAVEKWQYAANEHLVRGIAMSHCRLRYGDFSDTTGYHIMLWVEKAPAGFYEEVYTTVDNTFICPDRVYPVPVVNPLSKRELSDFFRLPENMLPIGESTIVPEQEKKPSQ